MLKGTLVLLVAGSFPLDASAKSFNEGKFGEVVEKMESDVKEFAQRVEALYTNRCDEATLSACFRSNYDDCLSVYEDQYCPAGTNFAIPTCGDGIECSGLRDFTASSVSIPGFERNPTDPSQIETVCFTKDLDNWFTQKRTDDKEYWDNLGVEPSGFYFGSHTGAFRIYPARHSEACGVYDPRIRPWYIAGSSGPKNVVLVLDTSGSMAGAKLEIMKEAAIRVVSTLAVGDRFAIVAFNSVQTTVGDEHLLVTATESNKARFMAAIEEMEAIGATNFYDAFTLAFDMLDRSIAEEASVRCNTAMIFLTDGEMSGPEGVTEEDVTTLVKSRVGSVATAIGHSPLLFTYSVSREADVHTFPSTLACSVETGVWSKITEFDQIVDSLSSYYFLFALGLGVDENQDFVAWTEPYVFATGGVLGTTVSVPVYDRSQEPHLFLGVVGGDFVLEALNAALGIDTSGGGSEESIRRVALLSTARCPRIALGLCELESYRANGAAGDEALCTANCSGSELVSVEAEACPFVSDYPKELWKNTDNDSKSYAERVCCHVGDTWADEQCPDSRRAATSAEIQDGASILTIALGTAAGGLVIIGFGVFMAWTTCQKKHHAQRVKIMLPPPAVVADQPHFRP